MTTKGAAQGTDSRYKPMVISNPMSIGIYNLCLSIAAIVKTEKQNMESYGI